MQLADRVAGAARSFLEVLDDGRVRAAIESFDSPARREWAYWPSPRLGVALWALDRDQAKAAHRLLATLLRLPAYARAVTIMNLDEVLDNLEGYKDDRRHGGDYSVAIFGGPGDNAWGIRFEGHHVSVHATVCRGEVRLTPLFLGANPAIVADGDHLVIAPLAPEEQLGFELLSSLSTEERDAAVLSEHAPDDIISRNQPRLHGTMPWPGGVPLAGLTAAAASTARELLRVYLGRFPDGAPRPDERDATFAWAGSQQPGAGHYYRVAGPRLLIEFDNTQNNANHVHTVVRDPLADFGDDILARHYLRSHSPEQ